MINLNNPTPFLIHNLIHSKNKTANLLKVREQKNNKMDPGNLLKKEENLKLNQSSSL